MGELSQDLRDLGYDNTEKESPFDDDGILWSKGYELVCDETGAVIRKDGSDRFFQWGQRDEKIYRYQNSENVKLPGGYIGKYNWGESEDGFLYDGDF
jgi:hypothetical protein